MLTICHKRNEELIMEFREYFYKKTIKCGRTIKIKLLIFLHHTTKMSPLFHHEQEFHKLRDFQKLVVILLFDPSSSSETQLSLRKTKREVFSRLILPSVADEIISASRPQQPELHEKFQRQEIFSLHLMRALLMNYYYCYY